jgi:glutamate-1-semialdehyde 2,1-aminomutase
VAVRLAEAGARLRTGVAEVVSGTPAEGHVFTAGRDCNLVFGTRDRTGAPSQVMRTIFMRGLLDGGVVGPSFVVNLGHTPELIDRTVDAVAAVLPEYCRALEGDAEAVLGGRPVRPALRRRG